MTLAEYCDFVYAIMVEDIYAVGMVDRQVSGAMIAADAIRAAWGAPTSNTKLADPSEYRERLDVWLEEDPAEVTPMDADRARLLQILGVPT